MARWKDDASFENFWEERTIIMSRFIPEGSSVIEFGAAKSTLMDHLPEGCSYTRSDLVDRGPGTIVIDLNNDSLVKIDKHDVAVFSGVLEYVRDIPNLAQEISKISTLVLASYAVRTPEDSKIQRRLQGWVNDFSEEDIQRIFCDAGFEKTEKVAEWNGQHIFLMRPKSKNKRDS